MTTETEKHKESDTTPGVEYDRPGISDHDIARQVDLELKMVDRGIERYGQTLRRNAERARKRQQGTGEATTKPGRDLLRRAAEKLAEGIKKWQATAEDGTRKGANQKRSLFYRISKEEIEPEVLAHITIKTIINAPTDGFQYGQTCLKIGEMIELERGIRMLEERYREDAEATRVKLKKQCATPAHARKVWAYRINQAGLTKSRLTKNQLFALGVLLVKLAKSLTGAFSFSISSASYNPATKRGGKYIVLSPETLDHLQTQHDLLCDQSPDLLPMVIPPKQWKPGDRGGYLLRLPGRNRGLVSSPHPGQMKWFRELQPPAVYKAINTVQDTAWRVNRRVLDVMLHCHKHGLELGSLPPKYGHDLPEKPNDFTTNEEARKSWRKEAAPIFDANAKIVSKWLQFDRTIKIADEFRDEPRVYFPCRFDFRGRLYVVGGHLNPQGSDYSKSLLHFAESKPLDPLAAWWLAVHIASLWGQNGIDKAALTDREAWTCDNTAMIRDIASDPFTHKEWAEAAEPWQFLAACFEWAGYIADPHGFRSSLPVSVDATCSGIQHYSALLRDKEGGRATNLTPSEVPNDIYNDVAEEAKRLLASDDYLEGLTTTAIRQDIETLRDWADKWLLYDFGRKLTKRAVMTMPYGSGRKACGRFIREHLDERIQGGEELPWGEAELSEWPGPVTLLSRAVWDAIGNVVIGARIGMAWLQKGSRISNHRGKGSAIRWVSPSGFPVVQKHLPKKKKPIVCRVDGVQQETTETVRVKGKLDRKRQRSGIAPNFIHSLDGAHLALTLERLDTFESPSGGRIASISTVHDCFAVLAADCSDIRRLLCETFATMYAENDPLEEIRDRNDWRDLELPEMGSLDLSEVAKSPYAFSP